jgi:4-hydroxybenzoate polyprenyltransferase
MANKKIFFSLIDLVKLTRPVHWVKNLSLFAALIFTGGLFTQALFLRVFAGFLIFNLVTSSAYIFNDLLDRKRDRLHPIKKNRPLAKGTVSPDIALFLFLFLSLLALLTANQLSYFFFLVVAIYLLLQIAYSLLLKHIAIIDILVIAAGFILRVYAGAFVIDAHLSVWFLLCALSIALFLAAGKRRAELGIVVGDQTRKSLSHYQRELLNSYVTMFGNAAWMSWALFTFFESPRVAMPLWLFLAELSKATTINKLLMATIPVTIFGIMRYESLIFAEKSEAPEKLLLTDLPLVLSVFLWVTMVVWILYSGASTVAY